MKVMSFSAGHPQFSDRLVHLTGRRRSKALGLPGDRLASILGEGHIHAGDKFSRQGSWYVSFTEATEENLHHLFSDNWYTPWGIVFDKELVHDRGGAPALYVRDDEWTETETWADSAKARAVAFNPRRADWLWEREWRIPGTDGFRFTQSEIVTVIVPAEARATWLANRGARPARELPRWFIELDTAGKVSPWTRPGRVKGQRAS